MLLNEKQEMLFELVDSLPQEQKKVFLQMVCDCEKEEPITLNRKRWGKENYKKGR